MTKPIPFPCAFDEGRVLALARSELAPGPRAEVESHLRSCAACREAFEFEGVRMLIRPLRTPRVPSSHADADRFVAEVRRRVAGEDRPHELSRAALRAAAVVAAALAVAGLLAHRHSVPSMARAPLPAVSTLALARATPARLSLRSPVEEVLLHRADAPAGRDGVGEVVFVVIDTEEAL